MQIFNCFGFDELDFNKNRFLKRNVSVFGQAQLFFISKNNEKNWSFLGTGEFQRV